MLPWRKRSETDEYIPDEVQRAIHERLNRIEGHVRGVGAMLNERRQCDEILIQIYPDLGYQVRPGSGGNSSDGESPGGLRRTGVEKW